MIPHSRWLSTHRRRDLVQPPLAGSYQVVFAEWCLVLIWARREVGCASEAGRSFLHPDYQFLPSPSVVRAVRVTTADSLGRTRHLLGKQILAFFPGGPPEGHIPLKARECYVHNLIYFSKHRKNILPVILNKWPCKNATLLR